MIDTHTHTHYKFTHTLLIYTHTYPPPTDTTMYSLVCIGNGPLYGTLQLLVFGSAEDDPLKAMEEVKRGGGNGGGTEPRPFPLPYYAHLTFCIVGLQVSYLIWGVLQVR